MPELENNLYQRIRERFASLQQIRLPFESMWEQIIELLRPDLSLWKDVDVQQQGKKPNLTVFSATPQESLANWSDGMQGHTASAAIDWFIYRMANAKIDKIPIVRQWLQEAEEVVYTLMRNSNYYSHLGPVFKDAGSLGNAPDWIEENQSQNGIACSNFHPREIFVDEDSAGIIDTWYRGPYEMTARNAAEFFGMDKISPSIKEALSKNPLQRFKFLHACHKQDDRIFKGINGLPDRPWISVYLELGNKEAQPQPLRISGYWSKPFSYWRFDKSPTSVYGVGLGCYALVDIFGINSITEIMLRSGHLSVNPAMYGHREMRGQVHVRPGGWTWGQRPEHQPTVLFDGGKYPYGTDREDRAAAAIERWFNVDFFLMLARADKTMTATEVMEKANERGILMAPKTGRMNSDLFDPHHDRIFDIALRNKWIEPPPQQVLEQTNGRIEVEYNGLLERAQRQQREITRTQVVIGQLQPLIATNMEVLDFFDLEKTAVRIARDGSWPEDEIRTPEDVAAIRQQRAQAQQAQAQMQMLAQAAETAPKLGKKVDPSSILAQMTGAGAK